MQGNFCVCMYVCARVHLYADAVSSLSAHEPLDMSSALPRVPLPQDKGKPQPQNRPPHRRQSSACSFARCVSRCCCPLIGYRRVTSVPDARQPRAGHGERRGEGERHTLGAERERGRLAHIYWSITRNGAFATTCTTRAHEHLHVSIPRDHMVAP